jgi:DNA-binding response OmpR family regulator
MSHEIRVLVGDDEVNDRVLVGWAFKKLCPHVRVDFVRSGEEAIRYLDDKSHPKPALVILDSMEPGMSGFEVVTWIRAHEDLAETAVVMWSGQVYEQNAARARGLGVKEYVSKPYEPDELANLIRSWRRSYLTPPSFAENTQTQLCQEPDTQQFFKLQ